MQRPKFFDFLTQIPFGQKPAEIERCFAKVFLSTDGRQVLRYLHQTITARALPADCSTEMLRHQEGQRALLQMILRMTERGSAE
tara:strand:+ start:1562 stop:1813 length:252 start_codon:yes stop_codon:yes gene_type:complete